jgi:hypothetical protein
MKKAVQPLPMESPDVAAKDTQRYSMKSSQVHCMIVLVSAALRKVKSCFLWRYLVRPIFVCFLRNTLLVALGVDEICSSTEMLSVQSSTFWLKRLYWYQLHWALKLGLPHGDTPLLCDVAQRPCIDLL